jgi:hypothetical protein
MRLLTSSFCPNPHAAAQPRPRATAAGDFNRLFRSVRWSPPPAPPHAFGVEYDGSLPVGIPPRGHTRKSRVLRRQALGDEDDAEAHWAPQTA